MTRPSPTAPEAIEAAKEWAASRPGLPPLAYSFWCMHLLLCSPQTLTEPGVPAEPAPSEVLR